MSTWQKALPTARDVYECPTWWAYKRPNDWDGGEPWPVFPIVLSVRYGFEVVEAEPRYNNVSDTYETRPISEYAGAWYWQKNKPPKPPSEIAIKMLEEALGVL